MSSRTAGKSIQELKKMAKSEGVENAHMFAEWLVDGEDHFNFFEYLNPPDYMVDNAFMEAQGWWNQGEE